MVSPCGSHDTGRLGRLINDEPGIHCNAVTADACTRLQDIDAWMNIYSTDDGPNINVELVADHRQFVREGYIDVPECVLGQLRHYFCGARVRDDHLILDEKTIEFERPHRADLVEPSKNTGIVDEFFECRPWQDSLRAVGHHDIRLSAGLVGKDQIRARICQQPGRAFGSPDRRRGLDDDDVPLFQHRRYRGAGRVDQGHVRRHVGVERCRNGNDEDIAFIRLCRSMKALRCHHVMDQHVQVALIEMDATVVVGANDVLVHVDAQHLKSRSGKRRRRWKSQITQIDDGDLTKRMHCSEYPQQFEGQQCHPRTDS